MNSEEKFKPNEMVDETKEWQARVALEEQVRQKLALITSAERRAGMLWEAKLAALTGVARWTGTMNHVSIAITVEEIASTLVARHLEGK